ncbi:MAG: aminoglycoside phosphotransferase family protein [Actinomycetota bacterium]|nr:aminoglycoside phosphotransferase family protein [Actinomycetota bacterium]
MTTVSGDGMRGLSALIGEGVLPPGRAQLGPDAAPRRPGDRETIEWIPAQGPSLVVKLYPDPGEGAASYRILVALWRHGFGPTSPYRVPEPRRWSATHSAIVMGRAPGRCLADHTTEEAGWLEGMRAAARWLGRLHASTLRVGPLDERARASQRLHRRLSKAVERQSQLAGLLAARMDELARRAPPLGASRCQTHGRFHPGHVFVAPELVTVIDLDRAAPADPAKDVAEFVHRTRAEVFKRGCFPQVAEEATLAFLDEYLRCGPAPLYGLAYFWSESLLATLLHAVRKRHLDEDRWRARIAFYLEEFDRVPERVASYTSWSYASPPSQQE